MYCDVNFRTKKQLKEAVAGGQAVGLFQPGPFGTGNVTSGSFCAEGPHYPEPHKWYATVKVVDGKIVSVK